jgi:hypothetical protein
MRRTGTAFALALVVLSSAAPFAARAEKIWTILAAQIRTQGYACDKPQRARRDAQLSRPDYDVWVLTCQNATYRIGRYPDRAANVEQLR